MLFRAAWRQCPCGQRGAGSTVAHRVQAPHPPCWNLLAEVSRTAHEAGRGCAEVTQSCHARSMPRGPCRRRPGAQMPGSVGTGTGRPEAVGPVALAHSGRLWGAGGAHLITGAICRGSHELARVASASTAETTTRAAAALQHSRTCRGKRTSEAGRRSRQCRRRTPGFCASAPPASAPPASAESPSTEPLQRRMGPPGGASGLRHGNVVATRRGICLGK